MAQTPEGEPLASKVKCDDHNSELVYWKRNKTEYIHYYCAMGDHWVDKPLAPADEVR